MYGDFTPAAGDVCDACGNHARCDEDSSTCLCTGGWTGAGWTSPGRQVIKFPSPLNALKDTYDHNC
jgi:hypothetical protein